MAKFSGAIGYALTQEDSPGVWVDTIIEKHYRGDVIVDQRQIQTSEQLNDNIAIDNSISIIANAYAYDNIGIMKYVVWRNIAWKIQSFSIDRPRIVIKIGGIYNGERPIASP